MMSALFWFLMVSASVGVRGRVVNFSVMSYNVRQLPTIPFRQEWDREQRIKHLAEALHSMTDQPDVIVFEELFYDWSEKYLVKMLKDTWQDYNFVTSNVGGCCQTSDRPGEWDSIEGATVSSCKLTLSNGGVLIMSKHPVLAKNAHIYSAYKTTSSDKHANKGAVHVQIRKGNENFHVIGTHLQADETEPDREAEMARSLQVSQIWVWVRDHLKMPKDEPVIVAGDMNVIVGSEEMKELLGPRGRLSNPYSFKGFDFRFSNTARLGSISPVQSFDARSNWCAKADGFYREYALDWHATLDYIMHMKEYKAPQRPASMRVIPLRAKQPWYWFFLDADKAGSSSPAWKSVLKTLNPKGVYADLSDHYPVRIDYEFEY